MQKSFHRKKIIINERFIIVLLFFTESWRNVVLQHGHNIVSPKLDMGKWKIPSDSIHAIHANISYLKSERDLLERYKSAARVLLHSCKSPVFLKYIYNEKCIKVRQQFQRDTLLLIMPTRSPTYTKSFFFSPIACVLSESTVLTSIFPECKAKH